MPLGFRVVKVVWWSLSARLASLHAKPNEDGAASMFISALYPNQGYQSLLARGIVLDLHVGMKRRAEMRFWAQGGGGMHILIRWWCGSGSSYCRVKSSRQVDISQRLSLKHSMVAKS